MRGRIVSRGLTRSPRLLPPHQMNLLTRLVGTHRLLLLPLYSYLQRYLSAHQAHVTQVLAFLIQVRRRTMGGGGEDVTHVEEWEVCAPT